MKKILSSLIPALFLALLISAPIPAQSDPVEFVIDLSGSMNRRVDGASIREHILKAVSNAVAGQSRYAVRVFGHQIDLTDQAQSCLDSELVVPFGRHPENFATKKLLSLSARGFTPLAFSLAKLAEDLRDVPGRKVVVLLSDGADSCGGNPSKQIAELQSQGIEVVVNPIGFWIDSDARTQLTSLAASTGGIFQEISDVEKLAPALNAAINNNPSAAIPPPKKAMPLSDIGADRDAGKDLESALPIEIGKRQKGARIGGAEVDDRIDVYSFTCRSGEKFEASTYVHEGRSDSVQMRILDPKGAELDMVKGEPLKDLTSSVVLVNDDGKCLLEIASNNPKEAVHYDLEVTALVRLGN